MASRTKTAGSHESPSNGKHNRSLPIRVTTPTSRRPAPITIQSGRSTASSSSSSSAPPSRIFDDDMLANDAESPTTPPDDFMTSLDETVVGSNDSTQDDSPSLKIHLRSKRPALVLDKNNTRHLQATGRVSPRSSAISKPPPRFLLAEATIRPRSCSVNSERSLLSSHDEQTIRPRSSSANAQPSLLPPHIEVGSYHDQDHKDKALNQVEIPDSDEEFGESPPVSPSASTCRPHESDDSQSEREQSDVGVVTPRNESKDSTTEHHRKAPLRTCPSEFTVYGDIRDERGINESIMQIMKTSRTPMKSRGLTYIFKSSAQPGHLKIGSTTQIKKRLKTLEKCYKDITLVKDHDENAFHFHSIVESLVHQELHNKRKVHDCGCGTKHKEWFEVEEEEALKSVSRWRTWIQVQKPYDERWKLTPYWQRKVESLPKTYARIDWDQWVAPTHEDYYWDLYAAEIVRLKQKDWRFWFVGLVLFLVMYFGYGTPCSMWILASLLLL